MQASESAVSGLTVNPEDQNPLTDLKNNNELYASETHFEY